MNHGIWKPLYTRSLFPLFWYFSRTLSINIFIIFCRWIELLFNYLFTYDWITNQIDFLFVYLILRIICTQLWYVKSLNIGRKTTLIILPCLNYINIICIFHLNFNILFLIIRISFSNILAVWIILIYYII